MIPVESAPLGPSVSYHPPPWHDPHEYLPTCNADVWVQPFANRSARVCEYTDEDGGQFRGLFRGEVFQWRVGKCYRWSYVERPADWTREMIDAICPWMNATSDSACESDPLSRKV